MEAREIGVLLVEDNPDDAVLVQEMLNDARNAKFSVKCVDSLSLGLECVIACPPDVALLDLSLPDSSGLNTFLKMHDRAPGVPVILLTGLNDERLAIDVLKKGGQDYLVKGQIDRFQLERAIRYAIERQNLQKKLDDFHRTIAHELRTPLTALKSAVGLLVDGSLGVVEDQQMY